MKKVALALATVMSAALVVPMTACGGGGFDIEDYAIDLDAYVKETAYGKEYTSATPIDGTVEPLSGDNGLVVRTQSDGSSRLYNFKTGETVSQSYFTEHVVLRGGFIAVKPTSYGSGRYQIYTPNAEQLFNGSLFPLPEVSTSVRFLNGRARTLYCFSFSSPEMSSITYKYGTYDSEKEGGTAVWKEYTEDELAKLGDISVGETSDVFYASRQALGNGSDRTSLDAYEYSVTNTNQGTLYLFYEDGKSSGSFILPNNGSLINGSSLSSSILDTSVFYATQDPVDAYAQEGYNFIQNGNKYQITYYRYDITKDSLDEIETDYIFRSFDSRLFNQDDKIYDAATASAYLKKNGVANSDDRDTKTLIIDADGDVVKDISDLPFSISGTIYKLKSNRYLLSRYGYIVDADLDIVASAESLSLAPSVDGLVFSANGQYGLLDYNGKVVLDNKYSRLSFAGKKAYAQTAYDTYGEEEATDVIVTLDGRYQTAQSLFFASGDDALTNLGNGLVVKRSWNTLTVYNYSGATLATVSSPDSSTGSLVTSSNGIAIYNFGGSYFRLA